MPGAATPSTFTAATNFLLFGTICVAAAWKTYFCRRLLTDDALTTRKKKNKFLLLEKKKKVVVITGCDRGFGRLLAEALSENNDYYDVVVALTLTKEAATELTQNNKGCIIGVQCDVTSDKDVAVMKERVEQLLTPVGDASLLYAIVNNAGIADPGDFAWFANDLATFQKVMDVNFMGQLRVTQALLPFMLRTSTEFGGRILNLSSVCGTSASPSNASYNASKFAVEAWSDSLRLELASFNVKVVKVRPGQFSTQIQSDWARNLLKNYQKASPQIRELYGGQKYADHVASVFAEMAESSSSSNNMAQPSDVVDALQDMLGMEQSRLKPSYWLGRDAYTLWRALHSLPTAVADGIKASLHFKPLERELPPHNVISHLTITVRSLETSLKFYKKFGLEPYGETANGQQFLRSSGAPSDKNSGKKQWATLVLLREDPNMPARGTSYDGGMTRLCLYTTNMQGDVQRLRKEHGLEPMAPTAFDEQGPTMAEYLTAYHDPDGFVVYLIEFRRAIGLMIRASLWWNRVTTPSLFHWTVNVTDAAKSMKMLEALGFVTFSDQNKDQVADGLLPAFNIDAESTVIEHIRMCKLPNENLFATIMEWVEPRTVVNKSSATNSMTIAVSDLDTALNLAAAAGMTVTEPEYRQLPVFGGVLVGTAYIEPNSCPIEFCSFTHKR